jgi:hypothetical protein
MPTTRPRAATESSARAVSAAPEGAVDEHFPVGRRERARTGSSSTLSWMEARQAPRRGKRSTVPRSLSATGRPHRARDALQAGRVPDHEAGRATTWTQQSFCRPASSRRCWGTRTRPLAVDLHVARPSLQRALGAQSCHGVRKTASRGEPRSAFDPRFPVASFVKPMTEPWCGVREHQLVSRPSPRAHARIRCGGARRASPSHRVETCCWPIGRESR